MQKLKNGNRKKLKKVSRFAFWGETDLEKVYLTNGIKIGAETSPGPAGLLFRYHFQRKH